MVSNTEMGRYALIKGALDGVYTVKYVAKRLCITERRVKQLKRAVRERGERAVVHGNSGRRPGNYTKEDVRQKIIELKKSGLYRDASFAYFKELLSSGEQIQIGYTALANILKEAGITSKNSHRRSGKKFTRRKRRSEFGSMPQTDATPYDWFGDGVYNALHGFIDDATGQLVGLYLCKNECLLGYLEALRQVLKNHGVPPDIYGDKTGIFFVNNKNPDNWTIDGQLAGKTLNKTRFGVIADDLGINLIAAHTPQAKGRVERMWRTLQDRLPTFLKINDIKNAESFNAFVPQIIAGFNKHYAVKPESEENPFVPLTAANNIDKLLAVKYERTTDSCGCFSFQKLKFQIICEKSIANKKIQFVFSRQIGFLALCGGKYYPVKPVSFLNNGKLLPDVTKYLLYTFYQEDGKMTSQPKILL